MEPEERQIIPHKHKASVFLNSLLIKYEAQPKMSKVKFKFSFSKPYIITLTSGMSDST